MSVDIETFLAGEGPLFDVRSPCEYDHAHIPGAVSLPLFSDQERAEVGTAYKRQGHDVAVLKGLEYVGPKMVEMAKAIGKHAKGKCRVMCFRGGMRSQSVAWLCGFLGFETVRLDGGYKAYRKKVLETFSYPWSFVILGGQTGGGKTEYLQKMKELGHQVIDLEGLANHYGSTFGLMPGQTQPSNEQYENDIATELWKMDISRPIFVEGESRLIGSCVIPKEMYEQMSKAPLIWLEVEREKRLERILSVYGELPRDWLAERTLCLQKRLGGERVKQIVESIETGDIRTAADELLAYYDKAYMNSSAQHQRVCTHVQEAELLDHVEQYF